MRVRLHSAYVMLGALYLPPGSQPELYDGHVGCIIDVFHKYSDDRLCIFGDFNLPQGRLEHLA